MITHSLLEILDYNIRMKHFLLPCLIALVLSSCDYNPNNISEINGNLVLLNKVANGEKYLTGSI